MFRRPGILAVLATVVAVVFAFNVGCSKKDKARLTDDFKDATPAYKPIDQDTVAAYEKLGATYGVFVINEHGVTAFREGKDAAAKGLPGFRFAPLPSGKLPPVQVPFGIDLSDTKVTDVGLKELKDLKNLATLGLGSTHMTDAGLKELKDLTNLTTLNLRHTKVTDSGLKELKDLKNLTTLHLGGTQVMGTGLRELKDLKNLTMLDLQSTPVRDAGLKELKELKSLTKLDLGYTKVTDVGLKELKDLKNLVKLDLLATQVTDAGLKELKSLNNLSVLGLSGTKLTDAALKELKDFKNLVRLDLQSTQVTDAGLQGLREALPKCEVIPQSSKLAKAGISNPKPPTTGEAKPTKEPADQPQKVDPMRFEVATIIHQLLGDQSDYYDIYGYKTRMLGVSFGDITTNTPLPYRNKRSPYFSKTIVDGDEEFVFDEDKSALLEILWVVPI